MEGLLQKPESRYFTVEEKCIWRNHMANYEKLVSFILEHVGGKENIENVTHCMTRLRFKLKDESKVEETILKSHKGIVTVQSSGGRYQVVIGTHQSSEFSADGRVTSSLYSITEYNKIAE